MLIEAKLHKLIDYQTSVLAESQKLKSTQHKLEINKLQKIAFLQKKKLEEIKDEISQVESECKLEKESAWIMWNSFLILFVLGSILGICQYMGFTKVIISSVITKTKH